MKIVVATVVLAGASAAGALDLLRVGPQGDYSNWTTLAEASSFVAVKWNTVG